MNPSSFRLLFAAVMLLLAIAAAPSSAATAPAQEALPKFDILEYDVEGNTRLSDIDIERAVTPWLGEDKTLMDVEGARQALERAYHDAGYLTALVTIPDQKVDDGNVTLKVVEATVDRLRVKGTEYHLVSGVKDKVPELAEGNVPYFPQVQRELADVNRSADLKVAPVLKAGRTPGTVEADLDADDQLPLHGGLELSNFNSPYTKPLRLTGTVRYDNLWQLGHSISLMAQTAPQATEQARNLALNYVMPVGTPGDALAFFAMHSRSDVPSYPTGVLGNTDSVGMRYMTTLPATPDYSQSLSLGVDHKRVKQTLVVGGPGGPQTELPAISYTPLVGAYRGTVLEQSGTTAVDATLTGGLRGVAGNNDNTFADKRYGASADFMILRGGVQQTQSFGGWSGNARAEVQLASGPLVANEQYAAGGAHSVRGYQESELLGDEALRLSLEVRSPYRAMGSAASGLRLAGIGFFEGVKLRTLQPVFPQPQYQTIRGVGVGLRVTGPHSLAFDLDLARALDDAQTTHAGDTRVHSRLSWDF